MLAVRNTGYGSSKFHLAADRHTLALCGRSSGMHREWWSHAGDAAEFLSVVPHRVCKRCARLHNA